MPKREPLYTTTAPRTGGAKPQHGGLKPVRVLLSDQHAQFLKEQESASALIRMLLDRYIEKQQGTRVNTHASRAHGPKRPVAQTLRAFHPTRR
jgi:hypothetical protein